MPIALSAVKKGSSRKPLAQIDPDIVEAVEEAYKHCLEVEDERIQAVFDTQDDAEKFLRDARSYAYQRPEGRVVVVGNTTTKGHARFRVETYVAPETGDDAEEE
jgi:hypothetical protein